MRQGKIRTTISETYNDDGTTWIRLETEVSPGETYNIDFDNPDKVRQCYEAIGRYLQNRGVFTSSDAICANEDHAEYR